MKLSTMIVGALAACTSALVAPTSSKSTVQVKGHGLDFSASLVNRLDSFPGASSIADIFACMKDDKNWTADWSLAEQGTVTFGSVSAECCNKAQGSWNEYHDTWDKLAAASFNDPCDGGRITGMNPQLAKVLSQMMGDHGRN